MKKYILPILSLGLMFSSCDMNYDQPGTITDNQSLTNVEEAQAYRNQLYSSLRGLTSGAFVYYTELEMDQFIGVVGNGNRGMYFTTLTADASYSDLSAIFNSLYSSMKNINFFLDNAPAIKAAYDAEGDTESSLAMERYIAEAKFVRGYYYYYLFDHYCQAYSADKGDTPALGVQLVTTYDPTGITSKYPGRSTMNETIALINESLTDAFNGLVDFEKTNKEFCKPNASYLSSYAVAALQARVALLTQDYATARDKANYVIGNTNYSLCEGDDYDAMWFEDYGNELIFVPFVNASESGSIDAISEGWYYYSVFPTMVDYIPTASVISSYADEDIRKMSFFDWNEFTCGDLGEFEFYYFAKFPGNNDLISGTNQYKNKPKPFRLSEQYLILAEAQNALGQDGLACTALNDLRRARIEGYTDINLTGNTLRDQIRAERAKELIGEGFRMSDLRRWNLGFSRDASYPFNPEVEAVFIPSSASVRLDAGDYRFVWPIPYSELQINPQLAGQQNPGWEN